MARPKKTHDPFRWFDSSPELIRLVVMIYVKYPLSLRNVEDLLAERGIDICHETVRLCWFRQMKTLQKFSSVHAAFHNPFNQDRHLISRETYKAQRSAALVEWKTLAG